MFIHDERNKIIFGQYSYQSIKIDILKKTLYKEHFVNIFKETQKINKNQKVESNDVHLLPLDIHTHKPFPADWTQREFSFHHDTLGLKPF